MRRADRLLAQEEALKILDQGEYGILSTVGIDGKPYGVPLSYIIKDNFIYCHGTNAGGSKFDNISENKRVSFTVVGKTQVLPDKFGTLYESAIVFGEATIVESEEEKVSAFREYLQKYSSDFLAEGEKYIESAGPKAMMYRITMDTVTGKRKS